MEYTPEQIKDIKEREEKAVASLKELGFTISAQVIPVNIGENVFANKIMPYLADTKYAEKKTEKPVEQKAQEPEKVEAVKDK